MCVDFPSYEKTPCCVDHCPYSIPPKESPATNDTTHDPKVRKNHKVDLHTHSPDKYNMGRVSQLLESKAHGTSVKSKQEGRCKTQCL